MTDGAASASDLEEIAEGRASSDDKREAAETFHVHSVDQARSKLRAMHGRKVKTTHKRVPAPPFR